ncbi:MAG TPA: type II toxin-antitoxin system RelE/ParE family toxin [Nodosilinea sp.]|nr:type II toxin-antitoxin system RelE/ParE family toxin [Nodosilinea sp.]
MTYRIEFTKPAAKQFKALQLQEQQRLKPKIDALSNEPRPSGVVKLSGEENLYRIRVGNYRIIYSLEDDQLLILVVKVGPRQDVYR